MIYIKISIPLKVKVNISLEIFSILQKHLSVNMKKRDFNIYQFNFFKNNLYHINNIKSPISLKTYKFKKLTEKIIPKNKKKDIYPIIVC